MKKHLVLMAIAAVLSITVLNAQGGRQRQTPEERTKAIMEKMVALNLDTAATTKTETVIAEFINAQQKALEDRRANGSKDREALMDRRKELAEARDAKLKTIFTEVQMNKWKDEIEPSMRRPGNNGPQGAN